MTLRPSTRWLTALSLAILSAGPALAQDQPAAPPRVQVSGRNADLRATFAPLARTVSPFVVQIEQGGSAKGYGVLIDGGFVLTSTSVVNAPGAFRTSGSAGARDASVVGIDGENDLALLRLSGAAPAGIAFGKAADLNIGQFVVVCGTAQEPIAVGVVSAKNRRVEASPQGGGNMLMSLLSDGNEGHKRAYPRVLHHDGPTDAAAFGAPVVDGQGRLVGLSVASPFRGSSHAIEVEQIQVALEGLKAGKTTQAPAVEAPTPRPTPPVAERPAPDRAPERAPAGAARPYLGVSCVDAPPERLKGTAFQFGLLVNEVQGPAATAGLRADDIVVALDGQQFASMNDFASSVGKKKIGDRAKLTVVRGALQVDLDVTLTARPR